jgi:AraC-like DNA-binding protein
MKVDASDYRDESVPAHAEMHRGYPVVVFGDHRFCAGQSTRVQRMPGPHMHSQIELNFVLTGRMTYWMDGDVLSLGAGELGLFWGMIPHQVTACDAGTEFVALYVPMSIFLDVTAISNLRDPIFRGAMIGAEAMRPYDRDLFLRWREDLLAEDDTLEEIVRAELTARLRRLARDGWHDLRGAAPMVRDAGGSGGDPDRIRKVEQMARFIGERGLDNIHAADVAAAAGLHPNYAMTLFRRAMGMTIKQSITRHRLDTAQSMLISTTLPAASIAFDCGYESLSSFYKAFQQRFHTSPAAFRRAFARPAAR